MKKMTKIVIAAAFVLASPLTFACDYPAPPKKLPDGTTADIAEMKIGVKQIADYQNKMDTYLNCIDADEAVAMMVLDEEDEEGKKQRKVMFDKKYNAAVLEQTRTVEQFNAEIREYKDRPKN